jgi:hypothetical protein
MLKPPTLLIHDHRPRQLYGSRPVCLVAATYRSMHDKTVESVIATSPLEQESCVALPICRRTTTKYPVQASCSALLSCFRHAASASYYRGEPLASAFCSRSNTHIHTYNLLRSAGLTRKGNYVHLLIQFLKWTLVTQSPYVLLFWLLSLLLLPFWSGAGTVALLSFILCQSGCQFPTVCFPISKLNWTCIVQVVTSGCAR